MVREPGSTVESRKWLDLKKKYAHSNAAMQHYCMNRYVEDAELAGCPTGEIREAAGNMALKRPVISGRCLVVDAPTR